jgi:hypothetical protein
MAGYSQLRRVQRNAYRLAEHYSIGMSDRGRVRSQDTRQKGFNGLSPCSRGLSEHGVFSAAATTKRLF